MMESLAFRAAKFNVVEDYFYGRNQNLAEERKPVTNFEDLVVLRGHHICTSKTFMKYLPKFFNSEEDREAENLMNFQTLKYQKILKPQSHIKYIEKFQEYVKKLRQLQISEQRELRKTKPSDFSIMESFINEDLAMHDRIQMKQHTETNLIDNVSSQQQKPSESQGSMKVHDASAVMSPAQLSPDELRNNNPTPLKSVHSNLSLPM